jgi:hypothetical protein
MKIAQILGIAVLIAVMLSSGGVLAVFGKRI